jgi:hypothetical protein
MIDYEKRKRNNTTFWLFIFYYCNGDNYCCGMDNIELKINKGENKIYGNKN